MTKKEIQKINKIKAVTMEEARRVSHNVDFARGFKWGFNVCRRKIRKELFGIINKNV